MKPMTKFILIIIGLLASISSFSQSNRIINLSGNIADKYPVKMILVINEDDVLGYYFYEKYQTKILLEGHLINDRITLKEAPDYENEFKKGFVGNIRNGHFQGVWKDATHNKELNFEAVIASDIEKVIKPETLEIQGTYQDKFNSDKYSGSVELKHITGNLFCFEISNGTETGCVGYLKGLIELSGAGLGTYTDDTCNNLTFKWDSKKIHITEDDCNWHGMRCPFEGDYLK
ncbi:hypothetical protein [Mangrovimonas sp. YM274]|uniref:hypothetical protein n=1 Tax=Mangrovimonas sp. YM274 TaxID=3070660 RepID=UPI0027DAE19E|nr:hypothetical protein [Mangrovimonas sp. YM274]WMI69313.1 hypothetical protein RBH95_02795 [Mangrovimonas sp. YM274]